MDKPKRKKPDDIKLPWGRNPLEGLLAPYGTLRSYNNAKKDQVEEPVKKKKKRYYSPKKDRPSCAKCGDHRWSVVSDSEFYRDLFLVCSGCSETFRTDLTPLDFQYAWRDGIPMPHEVKFKFSPEYKNDDNS